MKISTEKNTIKCLKSDIKQLNNKLSELQALFEVKEAELSLLKRNDSNVDFRHKNLLKTTTAGSSHEGHNISGVYEESSTSSRTVQGLDSQASSSAKSSTRDGELHGSFQTSNADNEQILVIEEDFPEVKVGFQAITVQ